MSQRRRDFQRLLRERVALMDGAMGTELFKRGLPLGVPPEVWVLERPEEVRGVHSAYVEAGAEIILTCTFGASRVRLQAGGRADRVGEINREATRIACSAAGSKALVGGSIGPLGLGRLLGSHTPGPEVSAAFEEQSRALSDAGVDLFVVETMTELQEALAAVEAVRTVAPDSPLALFFSPRSAPDDPEGFSDARSFLEMFREKVDVIGANCGEGPGKIFDGVIDLLCAESNSIPIGAKPSAGLPAAGRDGSLVYPCAADAFAESILGYAGMGARLLGGCCGTTPACIRAARSVIG